MPITLVTGKPGHGKSLRAIWQTEQERRTSPGSPDNPRAVWYDGITDLRLDWQQIAGDLKRTDFGTLDQVPAELVAAPENASVIDWYPAHLWQSVPDGALVVIDEAQRVFRPRGIGSRVPTFVKALETHRHRGIDFVLITQDAGLIDSNVRKLVDRHIHIKRPWGAQAATVYTFTEVQTDPHKSKDDAQSQSWPYPKEVYGYYKSAEIHTVKRRLPAVVYALPVMVLAVLLAGWFGYQRVRSLGTDTVRKGGLVQSSSNPAQGAITPPGAKSDTKDHVLTPAEYVQAHAPRIEGLAYSAPAYDAITKPTAAPAPAACVRSSTRCQCYTQQATLLQTPEALCRDIVAHGFFEEWDHSTHKEPSAPPVAAPALDRTATATPTPLPPATVPQPLAEALQAPQQTRLPNGRVIVRDLL